MTKVLLFTLLFGVSGFAWALAPAADGFPSNQIFRGNDLAPVQIGQALEGLRPGAVLILGEHHGTAEQALQQSYLIESISKTGILTSVGMEFFEYPQQAVVDQYRSGVLAESDFLAAIQWGKGFPFSAYRKQVGLPQWGREFVVALNAPRALTGKIAKSGIASLTAAEQALLPPDFTRGNANYFDRFLETMGGHVAPEKVENYFLAQSTWDDTMAWQASRFLAEHPEQILVIIVGEFHIQYGGGLPDRLRARGVSDIRTFSMLNLEGLSESEQVSELSPSPRWGPRADYIWTSRIKP